MYTLDTWYGSQRLVQRRILSKEQQRNNGEEDQERHSWILLLLGLVLLWSRYFVSE